MDEMRCTGKEEHLQDCVYNNHDDYCDSDDAAGVYVCRILKVKNFKSIFCQVWFAAMCPTLKTMLSYEVEKGKAGNFVSHDSQYCSARWVREGVWQCVCNEQPRLPWSCL